MKMILSLAQFDVQYGDLEANFSIVSEMVREAAGRGSSLILLPELWSSGYDLENWQRYASQIGDGIFSRLADLAKENQIWIAGTTLEVDSGRPYNTFTVYDDHGQLQALYRKIHLFRLIGEDQWLGAGSKPQMLQTKWGSIGLSICYDLRFPELFRKYAFNGAQIILLSAEWPESRTEHWRTLLQARAIENLFFVAATNRIGVSREGVYGGNSVVIGPWGHRLIEGTSAAELLTCEINLDDVNRARNRLPVFEDCRPDAYT
jgi:omega-amidase